MIADLGYTALMIAFVISVYGVLATIYGMVQHDERWVTSARNATILIFPLVLLACLALVASMLRSDFSLEYVARVTSRGMPTYLKVTALWGGQAGSLLFWNLLLAAFTSIAMLRHWRDEHELVPYALAISTVTQIFFLGISLFVENPFVRLSPIPADGNGLNPLLRHPGMIIHPPMLYLGFTGLTIPFAFAMAALLSGKLDDTWIRLTRRWTLVAWLFLSLGLILGGRWAYDVLGWGGYWAWDPVENSSFMPWLAGTAFLHSIMIQEKRDMFKIWNMFLVLLTYLLAIYGTFVVRSGVISSVHAFAQSAIGPLFFGFLVLMLLFSLAWIFIRWDKLRSENRLNSLLSREAAFLLNNFLFLGILFGTFWGTNYPIISELFTGDKATVGPPFYHKVNGPLFALLMLLMGVAPLTMWYRTSLKRLEIMMRWPALVTVLFVGALYALGVRSWVALLGYGLVTFAGIITLLEFWRGTRARMKKGEPPWTAFIRLMARNRRRYGGYWIHLGVVIMGFGIIGSTVYQQQRQLQLHQGESLTIGDFSMTFQGVDRFPGADDLVITEATVDIYKNGVFLKTLHPRTELYTRTNQPMTIPDKRSTVSEDFYALLINWEPVAADLATFKVYVNPLINWVWAGGFIFVLGTTIAGWSDPVPVREPLAARRRRVVVGGAATD
ncbi:MAG: heme lyase CcmF/NrfE family subunit [Anaerolineales bacterium]|nr:heme lyase CcmF/NrfE family subunit [Anaerolineales bacterium]